MTEFLSYLDRHESIAIILAFGFLFFGANVGSWLKSR